MQIKIFCNTCGHQMTEVDFDEAENLTGDEPCSECEKALSQVEKRKTEIDVSLQGLYEKYSKSFQEVFNKAKSDLEKTMNEIIEH